MPNRDGTGPMGQGAMTGGGRGYCAMPIDAMGKRVGRCNSEAGRGGRGRRNCFYATGLPGWMRVQKGMQAFGELGRTISQDDELGLLKKHADLLKQQLENTQTRIQSMASQQGSDKK